jgi:hypothetical protein
MEPSAVANSLPFRVGFCHGKKYFCHDSGKNRQKAVCMTDITSMMMICSAKRLN